MAIKLTDEGGLYILNCLFNGATVPAQLYVQLIAHATTPITMLADTDGNDTYPVVNGGVSGDSSKMIEDASVNAVMLDPFGIPRVEWDALTWTFTGPAVAGGVSGVTIYGYQVIVPADTYPVLFEELFATPFKPTTAGDMMIFTPMLLLGNGTPT